MTRSAPLAQILGRPDRRTLRLERSYDASPDDVWSALTEPEQIASWFALAVLEPRVGGRVELRGPDGSWQMTGMVRVFDPPRVFEYDWIDEHHTSIVRFELAPVGEGTRLTLIERILTDASCLRRGAGWHHMSERLEAHLKGLPDPGNTERYRALLGEYADALRKLETKT